MACAPRALVVLQLRLQPEQAPHHVALLLQVEKLVLTHPRHPLHVQGDAARVLVLQHAADQEARTPVRHVEQMAALEVAESLDGECSVSILARVGVHLLVLRDQVSVPGHVNLVNGRVVLGDFEKRHVVREHLATGEERTRCPTRSMWWLRSGEL